MKEINLKIDGEKIGGIIEGDNSEKIIILVHGFTGSMEGPNDLFIKLSNKLQEEGFSVCRFDFRGGGMSGGDFIDMTIEKQKKELEAVIEYIQAEGYSSISILGESMGGTVIGKLEGLNIFKSIIFWYTAFDLYDTDLKDLLISDKGEAEFMEKGYVDCDGFKVGSAFKKEFVNVQIFDEIRNIQVPTLIMHGDKDNDVSFKQSEVAYKIITSQIKKIKIIEGADHCFRKEHDEVVFDTVDFIKNN